MSNFRPLLVIHLDSGRVESIDTNVVALDGTRVIVTEDADNAGDGHKVFFDDSTLTEKAGGSTVIFQTLGVAHIANYNEMGDWATRFHALADRYETNSSVLVIDDAKRGLTAAHAEYQTSRFFSPSVDALNKANRAVIAAYIATSTSKQVTCGLFRPPSLHGQLLWAVSDAGAVKPGSCDFVIPNDTDEENKNASDLRRMLCDNYADETLRRQVEKYCGGTVLHWA